MFRNYLLVAIRNILRQKGYAIINISGLAIGIMSCLLIMLYVTNELSYDRFHEKGDRIYRLFFRYTSPNGETFNHAIGPYRLADELGTRYPEIQEAVRISFSNPMELRNGEIAFTEDNVMLADSNIFNLFTIDMIAGDPSTALADPFTCVISAEVAGKLFGSENPVGKSLQIDTEMGESEIRITGVFADFPDNSHIKPDALASMSTARYLFNDRQKNNWGEGTVAYYLLLPEDFSKVQLEDKFPALIREIFDDEEAPEYIQFWLQPLFDTHLKSDLRFDFEPHGDMTTVLVFSAIALFILLIASINYMNLSTARSARRAREVGLRKVAGGQRRQLILQFLAESTFLVFIAMVFALVLAHFLLPVFNTISGKSFTTGALLNVHVILVLLGATLVIGILSGSYPSFVLSSFRPIRVLYNDVSGGGSGYTLRKILVVLQFSISIALIISTLVIRAQWKHMNKMDLGINPENIVVAPRPSSGYETFKQEVLRNPNVRVVTSSNKRPAGRLTSNLGYKAEGLPEDAGKSIKIVTVDFDFFETLENRIVAGRSFSEDYSQDSVSSFILNETAVKDIGWDDPIGKWFETSTLDPETNNWKTRRGRVVGVAEDFHFESVHNTIQPVCFFVDRFWINWMSIRVSGENMQETLDFLEQQYLAVDPGGKFEYTFYKDDIDALYSSERRFFTLFLVFAVLAIFIASLGILGLASYAVEQRTREIGIRKVSGASESKIILLISREFTLLVLLANLFAWPVAWLAMRNWLMDFPVRIQPGIFYFLLAALLAFAIAMFTVWFQGRKAAHMDPVRALRYE